MSGKSSNGDDIFSLDRLRQIVELMKEFDLGEVDLQQDKQKIRIAKQSEQLPAQFVAPPMAAPVAPPAASAPPATAATGDAPSSADESHIVTITSPMVGTFYTKPNPESKDFVSVGDSITADKVICIIEAMKVFNEIPAEVSGKVVAVLAKNEEPVDFGKPLFKIDTRG